jgi:uncharacterized lipoprotein YehR (DUF1307 family)
MKKIIYITLFALVCSLSFTSCTEEEVTPKVETDNNGGAGGHDPIKG